jgi:hypothetical protein
MEEAIVSLRAHAWGVGRRMGWDEIVDVVSGLEAFARITALHYGDDYDYDMQSSSGILIRTAVDGALGKSPSTYGTYISIEIAVTPIAANQSNQPTNDRRTFQRAQAVPPSHSLAKMLHMQVCRRKEKERPTCRIQM